MSLQHAPDCTDGRVEVDDVDGPRGGRARITVCLDCATRHHTWLIPPAPKTPEPEHQFSDNPNAEREANYQAALLAHLQGRGAPRPTTETWATLEQRARLHASGSAW